MRPLPLLVRSRGEIDSLNQVFVRNRGLEFELAGERLRLFFEPRPLAFAPQWRADCRIEGRDARLFLASAFPLESIMPEQEPDMLRLLPGEVHQALAEAACEELVAALGKALGLSAQLIRLDGEPGALRDFAPGDTGLTFRRARGDARACLCVGQDRLLAERLAAAAAKALRGQSLPPGEFVEATPIPATLVLGWARATASELAGLGLGDIIVMNQAGPGETLLQAAAPWAWRGELEGRRFVVRGLHTQAHAQERRMQHDKTDATPTGSPDVDAIVVTLTFEVGEKQLTLAALKTLAPGVSIELDRPVAEPVLVRANGKPIARGDLLDIEGRVGVRVLELL